MELFTTSNFADADANSENDGLTASKSVESLTTLLTCMPDIVIPEPLYNPLPLQCLAANALPEAVCREIDQVLRECSTMTSTSSPRRLQADQLESGSEIGASVELKDEASSLGEEKITAEVEGTVSSEKSVVSTNEVSVGDMKKVIKWLFPKSLLALHFDHSKLAITSQQCWKRIVYHHC